MPARRCFQPDSTRPVHRPRTPSHPQPLASCPPRTVRTPQKDWRWRPCQPSRAWAERRPCCRSGQPSTRCTQAHSARQSCSSTVPLGTAAPPPMHSRRKSPARKPCRRSRLPETGRCPQRTRRTSSPLAPPRRSQGCTASAASRRSSRMRLVDTCSSRPAPPGCSRCQTCQLGTRALRCYREDSTRPARRPRTPSCLRCFASCPPHTAHRHQSGWRWPHFRPCTGWAVSRPYCTSGQASTARTAPRSAHPSGWSSARRGMAAVPPHPRHSTTQAHKRCNF